MDTRVFNFVKKTNQRWTEGLSGDLGFGICSSAGKDPGGHTRG